MITTERSNQNHLWFGTRHNKKIAYYCRSDSNLNSYVLQLTWLIPILIEVDSLEVARLVNDSDRCSAEGGFLVDEIKALSVFWKLVALATLFSNPGNATIYVAHTLAKSSLYENENMYCIKYGSEWLIELIKVDSDRWTFPPIYE